MRLSYISQLRQGNSFYQFISMLELIDTFRDHALGLAWTLVSHYRLAEVPALFWDFPLELTWTITRSLSLLCLLVSPAWLVLLVVLCSAPSFPVLCSTLSCAGGLRQCGCCRDPSAPTRHCGSVVSELFWAGYCWGGSTGPLLLLFWQGCVWYMVLPCWHVLVRFDLPC